LKKTNPVLTKNTPKKNTPKKNTAKKTGPKKNTPKKNGPKKTTPKKKNPKKTGAKKTTPKKKNPKKNVPKKNTNKKIGPKENNSKKIGGSKKNGSKKNNSKKNGNGPKNNNAPKPTGTTIVSSHGADTSNKGSSNTNPNNGATGSGASCFVSSGNKGHCVSSAAQCTQGSADGQYVAVVEPAYDCPNALCCSIGHVDLSGKTCSDSSGRKGRCVGMTDPGCQSGVDGAHSVCFTSAACGPPPRFYCKVA